MRVVTVSTAGDAATRRDTSRIASNQLQMTGAQPSPAAREVRVSQFVISGDSDLEIATGAVVCSAGNGREAAIRPERRRRLRTGYIQTREKSSGEQLAYTALFR